jgi:signal transduction histidine kinase
MRSSWNRPVSKAGWLVSCALIFLSGQLYDAHADKTNGLASRDSTARHTEAEQVWLRAHPEIRWGVDPDWPPFSSYDRQGKLVGIDADITRLAAQRVGLHLQVVPGNSWSEVLAKANAGEVDFLSATAQSSQRLEGYIYSTEYGSFPVVIITRDESPFLIPVPDLGSLSLAVQRDHVTTLRLQRDFPSARFVFTQTAEEALQAVAHRRADATVQNLAVATRTIRLKGLTNLKIAGITAYEFPLRFAVRKDYPELASLLNKGLATISQKEQETILAAHLTPDVADAANWARWRRRTLYISLAGALAVGLVLLWNVTLSRQIRRRRATEAALLATRDHLERRSAELQAVNESLESFSSSVSHDLRGPLRRINSFAQLLQMESDAGLAASTGDHLSVICKEATRMDRLIHDLLEFAQLGRAELRTKAVDMDKLVRGIITDFEPQIRERRVVWRVGALVEGQGDSGLLRYAVVNLIDNALKYTSRRPEAVIHIDVMPEEPSGKETTYYVQDNGCGFDMRETKSLFSPFGRLQNSEDYDGTGIGLANVQAIIHKHGGRIWFKGEPDKGATFYFTLPRPTPAREAADS